MEPHNYNTLNILHSIMPIHRVYPTQGSRPVLVTANNLKDYIVKYPFYQDYNRLLKEFLAWHFLKTWNLALPELVLLNIKKEHIPEKYLGGEINYVNFKNPVIGFNVIQEVKEIDQFVSNFPPYEINKIPKEDFLKIALFDIWTGNDDRNENNYNILLKATGGRYQVIPIDHEAIFNSGSLINDINLQTYEDSVINTSVFSVLLRKSEKNYMLIDNICANLQNNVDKCYNSLDEIFSIVPGSWSIDIPVYRERIIRNLFDPDWLKSVISTYKEFISLSIGLQ